jgi:hypothetical protein
VQLESAQMRELQSAVKEHVKSQLRDELEPLRVQLAVQQRKVQQLDSKVDNFHENHEQTRTELAQLARKEVLEKKMEAEPSPHFEAWRMNYDSRMSKAEGMLSEVSQLQEKFHQRQDLLMQCFADLDDRFEKCEKMSQNRPTTAQEQHRIHDDPDLHVMGEKESIPVVPSAGPNIFMTSTQEASLEVEEFVFQVDKTSGSLGLVLRNDGDTLIIDKINDGCVLPVNVGDRLVGINGKHMTSNAILEELRRKGRMAITCHRYLSTTL